MRRASKPRCTWRTARRSWPARAATSWKLRPPSSRSDRPSGIAPDRARYVRAVRTPICDRLGIEFPLFAFSHCRDVVAAVSKAGGYGVLGALAFSPDQLEIELSWIDEHVGGKPYGVDFA